MKIFGYNFYIATTGNNVLPKRTCGYFGDDKDRCTEGPLVETSGQNTKHLLYITDNHEHLEQGHMKRYVHGLSSAKLQIK